MQQAQEGINELAANVDSLMVIPNENLKLVSKEKITLLNAFEIANDVLRQGVQSISDLVNATGLVNCDFADVTEIMKDAGYAHMGVGHGKGKDKAEVAAQQAISSPLLLTVLAEFFLTSPVQQTSVLRKLMQHQVLLWKQYILIVKSSGVQTLMRSLRMK